jgi:hypothetical protein
MCTDYESYFNIHKDSFYLTTMEEQIDEEGLRKLREASMGVEIWAAPE